MPKLTLPHSCSKASILHFLTSLSSFPPHFYFQQYFPKHDYVNWWLISLSFQCFPWCFMLGSLSDFAPGKLLIPQSWPVCSGWSSLCLRTTNMKASGHLVFTYSVDVVRGPPQAKTKAWLSQSIRAKLRTSASSTKERWPHSSTGSARQQTAVRAAGSHLATHKAS